MAEAKKQYHLQQQLDAEAHAANAREQEQKVEEQRREIEELKREKVEASTMRAIERDRFSSEQKKSLAAAKKEASRLADTVVQQELRVERQQVEEDKVRARLKVLEDDWGPA